MTGGPATMAPTVGANHAPPRRVLAERLQALFADHRRPGTGAEYTCDEIAAEITAIGGQRISARSIARLRSGVVDNPTMRQIEALAAFFGVSPVAFFGEAAQDRLCGDLAALDDVGDPIIRRLAVRLARLDPQHIADISRLVDLWSTRERTA